MKKQLLLLSLFLVIVTTSFAQSAQVVPIPEFSGRPYFWKDNKISNLERADAQIDVKLKGLGYGGHDFNYSVFNAKSGVRFSKGQTLKFLIKVDKDVDPSEAFTVSRATVKKDKRFFVAMSRSMSGKSKDTGNTHVNAVYKKVREGIYEVSLPANIEEGEYAFISVGANATVSMSGLKISCFGID
jgi:hypothetical protein